MNKLAKILEKCGLNIGTFALIAIVAVNVAASWQNTAFHNAMAQGERNGRFGKGSLCVYYDAEHAFYSSEYIPEGYAAAKPDDVRYVITIQWGSTYSGMIQCNYEHAVSEKIKAYRSWANITITDDQTHEPIPDITIWGPEPPVKVLRTNKDTSAFRARKPSGAEITGAIALFLQTAR